MGSPMGDGGISRSTRGQHGGKPIEVVFVTGDGVLRDGGADAGGIEALAEDQARLGVRCTRVFFGLEGGGQHKVRVRHMLDDDAPWGFDSDEAILVGVVLPVRPVHDETPVAARARVADLEGIGESPWPPPAGEARRVQPGRADRGRRPGEHAR